MVELVAIEGIYWLKIIMSSFVSALHCKQIYMSMHASTNLINTTSDKACVEEYCKEVCIYFTCIDSYYTKNLKV